MDVVTERSISYKDVKQKYIKTPTVFQMEMTECGAASLSMIMKYYGVSISLEQLRLDTGVSRDGCKANKILAGARKYGFDASGYRSNLEDLFTVKPPCIIHWNFNHFMVYEGTKHGFVYINDPALGKRKLTIEEFDEGFTGVVLEIQPTDHLVKTKDNHQIFTFVLNRLKGQYEAVTYLILMGLLLVIPGLLAPIFSQIFIDDILIGGNRNWIHAFVLAMIFVALFKAVFQFYRNLILTRLKNKMSLVSAYVFLHHLFRLPMDFFAQRYAGDIGERVENNNNISEFLGGELAACVLNVIISFFYTALLFVYSPGLTILSIVVMAVYYLMIRKATGVFARTVVKLQQDLGKLTGVVISGVSIIATLKASGIENDYVGRILGYYAKVMDEKQRYQKMQLVFNESSTIVKQICSALVLLVGGLYVVQGTMTTGTLVAYLLLLGYFMTPINDLIIFGQKIQKTKADIGWVEDILKYQEDIKFEENEKCNLKNKLSGRIELKNIVFGYSRLESPLIQKLYISLERGKSIAIVGKSGSGKSTISKLVSGLYAPWEGEILFDQIPFSQIPKEVISSSIATVSQEINIFSGSIKDNITMWNSTIRDEEMIRAAKDALLHEVITKKPGRRHLLTELGGDDLNICIPSLYFENSDLEKWIFLIVALERAALEECAYEENEEEIVFAFANAIHLPLCSREDFGAEIVERIQCKLVTEELSLYRNENENEKMLQEGLQGIADVFHKKKALAQQKKTKNNLYQTVSLICEKRKNSIAPYETLVESCGRGFTIQDIARVSHFMIREVQLEGEWYQKESGDLLIYKERKDEESFVCVACLPAARSRYKEYNIEENTVKMVNEN